MTTTVIFVDSRMRTLGTDTDFEIDLRESVHLSNARLRVDRLTITDSFLTTDAGAHLYFSNGAGGISHVTIPEGAYTGPMLAAAIETTTGRTTIYDSATNAITHTIVPGQGWLSDKQLEGFSAGFPTGASAQDPKSLNAVLGDGENRVTTVTWHFVRMAPYSYLFIKSSKLRCVDHHGPRGTHDILCTVPLTSGTGHRSKHPLPKAFTTTSRENSAFAASTPA